MITTSLKTQNGITTITSYTDINVTKETVWLVLRDIGEIEKFHPLISKSQAISELKSGVGARRYCELIPMGRMEEEVVEWNEGNSIILKVVGGKMLPPYVFMNGKINLEENGNKTRVTFSFSYQLKYGVFGKMMNTLFVRPQFKKAPPKYVSGLKDYVEKNNV